MSPGTDARRALIAYDGSPPSKSAVTEAARLLRSRGAVVVMAWHSLEHTAAATHIAVPARVAREAVERHDGEARRKAADLAEEGAALARTCGLDAVGLVRAAGPNVPTAIARVADEEDASVLVVGSSGRSRLEHFVLGSTAATLVQQRSRPVLLVHAGLPGDTEDAGDEPAEEDGTRASDAGGSDRPLVFAYDGTETARAAVRRSAELLAVRPAVALTVWESVGSGVFRHELPESLEIAHDVVDELDRGEREIAEETATAGAELVRSVGFEAEPLARRALEGGRRDATTAWKEVVRTADELNAGAVVVGSRQLSGFRSTVLGSVSHGVVHHCRQPVVVVPGE